MAIIGQAMLKHSAKEKKMPSSEKSRSKCQDCFSQVALPCHSLLSFSRKNELALYAAVPMPDAFMQHDQFSLPTVYNIAQAANERMEESRTRAPISCKTIRNHPISSAQKRKAQRHVLCLLFPYQCSSAHEQMQA